MSDQNDDNIYGAEELEFLKAANEMQAPTHDGADDVDVVYIGCFDSDNQGRDEARISRGFHHRVLAPVYHEVGVKLKESISRNVRYAWFNTLIRGEAADQAGAYRLLHHAKLCIADVTNYDHRALSYLSIRQVLSSGPSIAMYRRGERRVWPVNIQPILQFADKDNQVDFATTVRDELVGALSRSVYNTQFDSAIHSRLPALSVNLKGSPRLEDELPQFAKYRITKLGEQSPIIALAVGDIRKAKNIDVWVNPENTGMEMARPYAPSISGTVRHLSSVWTPDYTVSDDFMQRELARRTPEGGVEEGSAIMTRTSGTLANENGVKRVVHVAAVKERAKSQPGSGYTSIQNVGVCVKNALKLIDKENQFRLNNLETVILPLIGTATTPSAAEKNVASMVKAVTDYFCDSGTSRIRAVALLGYTDEDERLIRRTFAASETTLEDTGERTGEL